MAKLLSFMGKFAISGSFCIVYIFAAELFPTEVRCIGIGFCSMMGNLGGLISDESSHRLLYFCQILMG